jgi:hypothetical protein
LRFQASHGKKFLRPPSQPIVDAVVLTCQTSNDENHQQENRGPDCHGQKGRTYLKKKNKKPKSKRAESMTQVVELLRSKPDAISVVFFCIINYPPNLVA